MSDSRRVEGERVYCHQCENEWDRAHGGLTCPRCEGEFVEILSPNTTTVREHSPPTSQEPPPPIPPHPFHDHNPWADTPDPDEGDIRSFQFNTSGGGHGTFTFSTRSYPVRGNNSRVPPPLFGMSPFGFGPPPGNGFAGLESGAWPPRDRDAPGNMQDIFSLIFQSMQHGGAFQQPRQGGGRPPNPFDLLNAVLNPANARSGDMVWSQEAFDRIVEQLAEQNQGSGAPGPAAESAIRSLPTKKVDESMMGSDGKAECSICMDGVEIGNDVTVLPCNHWFHRDCVSAWLKEHDTCPHCRKPITPDANQPQSSRRRSSRRSSSIASPFGVEAGRGNPFAPPDSPSGLREARRQYYGPRRDPDFERPRNNRHSSSHSDRHETNRSASTGAGGNSGGVTGWIRNRMNLG